MSFRTRFAVIVSLLALPFAVPAQSPSPRTTLLDGDYFESPVRPAQSTQCFSCHGLEPQKKSTRFMPPRLAQPRGVAFGFELDELLDDLG